MMPRGVTQTRVRRRQSDAKWRASVAMCYNIMKHVIPNQRKLGRRKISKALTLKETERHILALERVLKELLEEKARIYSKTVVIPKENNILMPATFEDVRNDFADRQLLFFSNNAGSGKKRYNVPTDIEASLDHLSLQACPLVVLDQAEASQGALTVSKRPAEAEQEKARPEKGRFGTRLQSLLTTPLGRNQAFVPQAVHKPASSLLKTPCKVPPRTETVSRLKPSSVTPARVISVKKEGTPGKPTYIKVEAFTTPSKACKQLPFSQSSGFTPIKLPCGLDGAADNLSSLPSTPAKSMIESTIGSPFSSFSLPQTPNSCFNGVEYFDNVSTSLLCNESIDNLDLEDVPKTPSGQKNQEEQNKSAVKTASTPFRTPSGTVRDPEETETDESLVKNTQERYGDDFGLRKLKSSKCRRRLDRSYQRKPTAEHQTSNNLDSSEFDGFMFFYNQNAGEIDGGKSFEDKAVSIAKMWKSLAPDDRAAYCRIAALENTHSSNHLSDDLRGLELKPLTKTEDECEFGVLDLERSPQEVPDLDLSASLLVQGSDVKYELVPEYADLGIICDIGMEKEDSHTHMPKEEQSIEDTQIVPDIYAA